MTPAQPPISIAALAAMVDAIQDRHLAAQADPPPPIETGWAPIARRALHEWFADAPPQTLMIDLAARAPGNTPGSTPPSRRAGTIATPGIPGSDTSENIAPVSRISEGKTSGGVFWVGRVCWPYAPALARGRAKTAGLLERSVLVDVPARQRSARVWAIDLVLRSPATLAVIADGRDLSTAQSRRLQLAAESGPALALLWRRPDETRAISVAHYRWRVTPAPTATKRPRWFIEPLRCKGAAAWRENQAQNTYLVEDRGAKGVVAVPADLADAPRSAEAAPAATRRDARRTA